MMLPVIITMCDVLPSLYWCAIVELCASYCVFRSPHYTLTGVGVVIASLTLAAFAI